MSAPRFNSNFSLCYLDFISVYLSIYLPTYLSIYLYNYILLNLREVATLHIIQSLREKEPFLLGQLGFVGLDLFFEHFGW